MVMTFLTMADIFFNENENGENYLQLSELMLLLVCKRIQNVREKDKNGVKQI